MHSLKYLELHKHQLTFQIDYVFRQFLHESIFAFSTSQEFIILVISIENLDFMIKIGKFSV